MTLWSTEKMYLRQKGSSWWPWLVEALMRVGSSRLLLGGGLLVVGRGAGGRLRGRGGVLRLPLGVVLGRVDQDVGAHAVMAEAAELRAGQFEVAGLGGLEPDGDARTGNGVLLHAQDGDVEAVDHVLGADLDDHVLVHREVELVHGGDVVLAVRVVGVHAKRVVARHARLAGLAELPVLAGVVE